MNQEFIVYLYVFSISIFAGTAFHIKKIKDGILESFRLSEWFGDTFISSFIGFLTYSLVSYFEIDLTLGSFLIGVASHQGTKVIKIYEDFFNKYIDNLVRK